ncbi:MAG: hypothetical protein HYT11_00095 [Candidatus Levybacteria bacterium]|nr:hypothetical protein [Candidatus Levybacteria bacterium]
MSPLERERNLQLDRYNIPLLTAEMGKYGYDIVLHMAETITTMEEARKLALIGNGMQAVVIADHQTQGVGRDEGKKWHDRPGCSILASVLLHIDDSVIYELSDLVALHLCGLLRETTDSQAIKIKPPNDIVANGKKLAGILTQNIYDVNHRYKGTNVGIGINVHYTQDELETFPADYGATSLNLLTGDVNTRQSLLIDILPAIAAIGPDTEVINKNQSVRNEYDARWQYFSYVLGRFVRVYKDEQVVTEGEVIDTGVGRGILIATTDGCLKTISLFDSNTKIRISD